MAAGTPGHAPGMRPQRRVTLGGISLPSTAPLSAVAPGVAHWLDGCDPTPGIVAVDADTSGRARVWRRAADGTVELEELRFPTWFLASRVDFLSHLPTRDLDTADLRAAHGSLSPPDGVAIVRLDGGAEGDFRYLVLVDDLADLEPALLEAWNKQGGGSVERLADLRETIAVWPPLVQYLLLSGRAYYRGLGFDDVRRLQFDLETTGLDDLRDRIFMVSLRDSSGWRACLDIAQIGGEAALIERFVELVRERDPDVLENHNIFEFDLRFLVRRSAALGVRLALGRDGSEPRPEPAVFRTEDVSEPFTRWRIAGREVIDTLHTVKRHGATTRALRRHGLKEVARFFGFARADREYVPGAEIWATFQRDPERVRRYAQDDVEEVDHLARLLMGLPFALASIVPLSYEALALDGTPRGLLDPLLVRAYLHEGRALPGFPRARASNVPRAGGTQLFVTGVVRNVRRLVLEDLAPRLLVADGIRPAGDALGVLPALVGSALAGEEANAAVAADVTASVSERARAAALDAACTRLARASRAYLADARAFFGDPTAAAELARRCREVIDGLLAAAERSGATPIEVDDDTLLLGLPEAWTADEEEALLRALKAYLPDGVRLRPDGRFAAAYAHGERAHMLLGEDGSVQILGSTFQSSRQERYGERFVRAAAPLVLAGDAAGLRRLFLETVDRLRAHEVPVEDLSAQSILRKSPAEYRRLNHTQEPYDTLLASGVKSWRVGHRVRLFRDRSGALRLLREGDGTLPSEADVEHYMERLRTRYARHFAQAFRPEDFKRIFALPRAAGLFDAEDAEAIAAIRPVVERVPPPES